MFFCSLSRATTRFVSYSAWSKVKHSLSKNALPNNTTSQQSPTNSNHPTKHNSKSQIVFPFPFYAHNIHQSIQRVEDLATAEQFYTQHRIQIPDKSNSNLEYIDRKKKNTQFQNVLQLIRGPLGNKIEKSILPHSSITSKSFENIIQSIENLLEEYRSLDTIVGYHNYFLTALDYLERYVRPQLEKYLMQIKFRNQLIRLYSQIIAQLSRGSYFYHNGKASFVYKRFEEDTLYAMELFEDIKLVLFEEEKRKLLNSVNDLDSRELLGTIFQKNFQNRSAKELQFIEEQFLQYADGNASPLCKIVSSIVSSYGHLGLPDFGLEFINSVEKESGGVFSCTIDIYDFVLQPYCRMQKVEEAEKLFTVLKREKEGLLREDVFRRMALLYASLEDNNKVVEVIRSMKKYNIVPSATLFKEVTCVFVDCLNSVAVIELLQMLNEFGSQTQYRDELFLFALQQFTSRKLLQICYSFINLAKKIGIKLVPEAYDYLLEMNSSMGNLEDMVFLFDTMKQDGVYPTVQNYNTLIYGLCVNGKPVDALQYFYQLVYETQMKPQSQTIAIAVSCFSTPEEAVDFITTFTTEPWSITMTTPILNSLLKLYCLHGRVKEALRLVKQSQETFGLHYDLDTVSTLIRYLVLQSCDLKSAEVWFQEAFGMREYSKGKVVQTATPSDKRISLTPNLDIFVVLFTGYAFEAATDKMESVDMRRVAYCVSHTPESKKYFEDVKEFIAGYLERRRQMRLYIPPNNELFFSRRGQYYSKVNDMDDSNQISDGDGQYYIKLFEQIQTELNQVFENDYNSQYKFHKIN